MTDASGERLTLRAIDVKRFRAVTPVTTPGRAPRLEWLAIADLVIDPLYQRPISPAGERNIIRIAEGFDWTAFSTVIVAPSGARGKYAIIDGQHRVHAAKLIGLDRVPCQIVDANQAAQARAFGRVNANLTPVPGPAKFHALLASGDPAAKEVAEIAAEGGATIARYPIQAKDMKPRVTLLTWRLRDFARVHGRDMVVLALRAIIETPKDNAIYPGNAGLVKYEIVGGTTKAFSERRDWPQGALMDAFGSFDLGRVRASVGGQATRMNVAADEIGRRLDTWARSHRAAFEGPVAPQRSAADESTIMRTASGVSLPRLKTLERSQ